MARAFCVALEKGPEECGLESILDRSAVKGEDQSPTAKVPFQASIQDEGNGRQPPPMAIQTWEVPSE